MRKVTIAFFFIVVFLISASAAIAQECCTGLEIVIHNRTDKAIKFKLTGREPIEGHAGSGSTTIEQPQEFFPGKTTEYKYNLHLSYAYTRGADCLLTVSNTAPMEYDGPPTATSYGEVQSVEIPWWKVEISPSTHPDGRTDVTQLDIYVTQQNY